MHGRQHRKNFKLLVVEGAGPCLMGRDWLGVVKLDWRIIGKISTSEGSLEDRIAVLQSRYNEVFSETLGTITPYEAKLNVVPGANPKFFKPHPVPYALKQCVNMELDRLESEGVIEKLTYSEWATPLVTVPKREGRVRLCGDYKVTVTPLFQEKGFAAATSFR